MKENNFKFLARLLTLAIVCLGISGCSDSDNGDTPLTPGKMKVNNCTILNIDPEITGETSFSWEVTKSASALYSLTDNTSRTPQFIAVIPGEYELTVTAGNQTRVITITVEEEKKYSAYISNVFEYFPAVGQFINELPEYEDGDTAETMRKKAENEIKGSDATMITLGGFGGYVTFGFDHTIANISGKRDFRILGNAFWAAANPNPDAPNRGGSCEPGVIMVAYDKNKNGKPDDDEWYEIAGSEHSNPKTIKNYEITYYRPDPSKTPVLDERYQWASDIEYIKWTDNQGGSGYKAKNIYHSQNYFPKWIKEDKITLKGTLLPNNAIDESGEGTYWVLYSFEWGYADNAPNNDDESAIDIDWAVDKNGNKVHLPGIDFIKVYSGVNQEAGWLGETSTEVAGAYDLHLSGISIDTRK